MESFSKRSILIEMQFESNCLWIQFYNKDQTARIYLKTKADWSRVLWTWQLSYERREGGICGPDTPYLWFWIIYDLN